MRPENCHKPKRVIREFPETLIVEEPRKTLREIIDSMLGGVPTSSDIRQHTPLVPDGEDLDDFDIGTREIVDLVDQQHLEEEIADYHSKVAKEQSEAAIKANQEAFEQAVEAEIVKRQQAQPSVG